MKFKLLLLPLLAVLMYIPVSAQQVSVKTNLLYDATLSPALGVEMRVAPRWSIDLSGNLNAWTLSNGRRWKHWRVQPEARFWLCDATAGHFFAVHATGGKYNVGHLSFAHDFLGHNFSELRDHRYQGWFIGAGLGYGYSWTLNKHWSIEAELALGWIRTGYDIFECKGCGKRVGEDRKDLFMPTKAAIDLIYVF